MPYYIEEGNAACAVGEWATVKEDGELMGCHATKQDAIDQGVAISVAEDSTFEGERSEERLDSGPGAVIVDIDGTLILGGRANQRVIAYVDSFDDTEIIVLTARLETERANTLDELEAAGVDFDQLIMKPDADVDSADFKEAEASRLLETFNVMVAIDNDPDNRERFRGLGITTLNTDEVPDVRFVDLTAPGSIRAIARRAVTDSTDVNAVKSGNMTPAIWVSVRDSLRANASVLWGVTLADTVSTRLLAQAEDVVGRIEKANEGRAKGSALSKLETRIVDVDEFEVREDAQGMHLEGYAALFNSRSENLGGFTETINPGAFRSSLKARNDIKLLWNHETSAVMGSTRAGTLTLIEDNRGLRVSATLPDTTHGRDARELVKRGDVTGFSFGFSMPARGGDQWNSEGTERVLKSVRLHEVSLTPFPAYQQTNGTASVRGLDKIAKRAEVDADALADALLKIENGEDITSDDRTLLQSVINELAPEPEAKDPGLDHGLQMLALKKKKLQILMGS
jgi:uncharacterized protein